MAVDVAGFTTDFYFCASPFSFCWAPRSFDGWLWLHYPKLLPFLKLKFGVVNTASVCRGLCGEAVFSLSAHPPHSKTPSRLHSHHIRPWLTEAKQEVGTLDSLSYYLEHRPAIPLTLCHIAYSRYKPSYTLTCGFNPSFPTGLCKHFVHLLMFCLDPSASAHAGVILIYYLLWQPREWRGVGESILSAPKCLTIWMKFSMRKNKKASPIFFYLYSCWWKDGKGQRERGREGNDRRSKKAVWYCGDRREGKGGDGVSHSDRPLRVHGPLVVTAPGKRGVQSDEARGLPVWQERHLMRGSVSNMATPWPVSHGPLLPLLVPWFYQQWCQKRGKQ